MFNPVVYAKVAELADASDLGSGGPERPVGVRVPPFALLLFLLLLPLPCQATQTLFPPVDSLARFPFTAGAPLGARRWSLSLEYTHANLYALDFAHDSVNDMELFSHTLLYRRGLDKDWTFEGAVTFSFVSGGYLDSLVEGFHSLFSYPEARRDLYPKNRVNYRLGDGFSHLSPSVQSGPLILGLSRRVYGKGPLSLDLRFSLGLPLVATAGLSPRNPFLVWGGSAAWQITRNLSLELYHHRALFPRPGWIPEQEPLNSTFSQDELRLSLSRIRLSILSRSSPYRVGDRRHAARAVSLSIPLSRRLEAGIIEDLPPFDTSADSSFFLRASFSR